MNISARFLLWGENRIEKGAWFFAPISWIWGFVSFLKNRCYDTQWFLPVSVSCPVVSVGNIVAGGTGKTPFVLLLAERFSHRKVAVISRGYGEVPDEALLLQKRLSNVRVYAGKDRVCLAKKAVEEGAELIILDDGFQYRKLHRDFDLVLLSARDPFGKGHFLPWGLLRDSPKRLSQADHVFVSGQGEKSEGFSPLVLETRVDRVVDREGKSVAVQGIKGALFSGIAKPDRFKKTALALGVDVIAEWVLADHEKPTDRSLQKFAQVAVKKGAQGLFCTEKDFVKINPSVQLDLPLFVIEISQRVTQGEKIWENLIAKIDQKIDNFRI